jgi:UDP-N-acetylmuramate--alanine ligase
VPFYGLAVMCIDHPEVANLLSRIKDRRVVTYGFSASADLRAENVVTEGGVTRFDALVLERSGERRRIERITLPMPGRHNVQNALAAVAVGLELGLSDERIAGGFERFGGVKRRFTRVGEVDGTVIIDDYAHHPVEIRAVLSAARDSTNSMAGAEAGALGGRVIAVVQPHRFTRLRDLMEDFANAFVEADAVLVAPVYAAGEEPIDGIDAAALAEGIRAHGHRMVQTISGPEELARTLRDLAAEGDLVICMGAGDITKWAAGLAAAVAHERSHKSELAHA